MADITSQFAFSERESSAFRRMLASIGRGFSEYAYKRSRRDRIDALEAKSDAELAAMGLRREDIPYHVFRDLYYI